ELVYTLERIPGRESTEALARLAVFDLSERVRRSAFWVLRERRRDQARGVFLEALRHVWAPAAGHAATALVDLEDTYALPGLRKLKDAPDPAAPFKDDRGRLVVRELVRVNHLRNCLLCHAPSADRDDPVRAPIPEPGKALPRAYYESVRGDAVR